MQTVSMSSDASVEKKELPEWADKQWSTDLPVLRSRGESQDLEYMVSFPDQARDLAKEIAAFATSNQGTIIIGVSDSGDLAGLDDALTAVGRDSFLRRIEGICRGTIKPSITPIVKFAVENGGPVLVILVPKGSQPVYYSNNIPYLRHLTESRPADPHEVVELIRGWLPTSQVGGEESNPLSDVISRLASVLTDVIVYGEEADKRMFNPWLGLWRAQFEQAAVALRELSIDDTAIEHGLSQELTELATALDELAHLQLHSGIGDELERRIADVLKKAQDLKAKWVDPLPLSAGSLRGIRNSIVQGARKLRGLSDRAEELLYHGRIGDFQSEASSIGAELLRGAQFNLDSILPGLADRLKEIGRQLHLVETRQVYLDGGRSVQAISDIVEKSCAELEKIASELTA